MLSHNPPTRVKKVVVVVVVMVVVMEAVAVMALATVEVAAIVVVMVEIMMWLTITMTLTIVSCTRYSLEPGDWDTGLGCVIRTAGTQGLGRDDLEVTRVHPAAASLPLSDSEELVSNIVLISTTADTTTVSTAEVTVFVSGSCCIVCFWIA